MHIFKGGGGWDRKLTLTVTEVLDLYVQKSTLSFTICSTVGFSDYKSDLTLYVGIRRRVHEV